MKLDADEKEMLESVERGEWQSARGGKRERTRYSRVRRGNVPERSPTEHPASSRDLERSRSARSLKACRTSR
jgi:hypothetical protein